MRATRPLITTDGIENLCELQCRDYERRQRPSYTHVRGNGQHTVETSPHQGEIPGNGTGPAA